MLLLQQQAILKAPPAVTDSLKHSLAQMQHKVDSLEKVVTKTEIGTGFFSDALATNLSLFVAIIGLSALISWGYFQSTLRNFRKNIFQEVNKILSISEKSYTSKFTELSDNLKLTIYDVDRAMYFIVEEDNDKYNAFDWAFSCAHSGFEGYPEDTKSIIFWLNSAKEHLMTLQVGESSLIKDIDKYKNKIDKLRIIENGPIQSLLKEIQSEIYHRVYSKPQPPGDIMKDAVV